MTIQTVPAQADMPFDRVAELLWTTDPALWSYLFSKPALLERVVAIEWPAPIALLSHASTTVVLNNQRLDGLCAAYTVPEMEAAFDATLELQPSVLAPADAAHLSQGLFWMDRLFPAPRDDAFHIMELVVSRETQGQGLAKALLLDASERASAAGCSWLTLDVAADNPAVGFYQHLGFQVEVETKVPELVENGIGAHLHMARAIT